jgi:hypothetical protein
MAGGGKHQFLDLTGSGQIDLVLLDQPAGSLSAPPMSPGSRSGLQCVLNNSSLMIEDLPSLGGALPDC